MSSYISESVSFNIKTINSNNITQYTYFYIWIPLDIGCERVYKSVC